MRAGLPLVASVAVAIAWIAFISSESQGQVRATRDPTASSQVLHGDLRYYIENVDEGYLVLLDRDGIFNDREWRTHFSGQIQGFGIRTPQKALSRKDLDHIKALLLDSSNWGTEDKLCSLEGDAALVVRGPIAEVTIMFELWCGRAHVRDETTTCLTAYGQIDPMLSGLRAVVRKYFPEDEYLKTLETRR